MARQAAAQKTTKPSATMSVDMGISKKGNYFRLRVTLVGVVLVGGSGYAFHQVFAEGTAPTPVARDSVSQRPDRPVPTRIGPESSSGFPTAAPPQVTMTSEQIEATIIRACGQGSGIVSYGNTGGTIRGNVTHDNAGSGICDVQSNYSDIHNNNSYRNGRDPSKSSVNQR
jgi:hypothetical protein